MKISNKKNSKLMLGIGGVALVMIIAIAASFSDIFDRGEPSPECIPVNDSRCIDIKHNPPVNTTIASRIGFEKVAFLERLVEKPIIQNALKASNDIDSKMDKDIRNQIFDMREKEWIRSIQPTPFMNSIIDNNIADFLRDNLVNPSEEFGYVVFGEHILTNLYGPNVAVSIKTDNYLQSNDAWWQKFNNDLKHETFARECEFDSSAQMYSEDLVIGIFDVQTGELIGIMNSATPCDVTQDYLDADKSIKKVPEENFSDIGKHKIFVLQELMKEPTIQEALMQSNQEFSFFTDEEILELKEQPWPKPEKEPTEFQLSIINNEVANILRNNLLVESADYGELQFPEMILTNNKGVNVASTNRTYNYIQFHEEWWDVAYEIKVLVRECGWDKSVQMSSEDIIIKIFDKNDEFIGILNSASTCNVILDEHKIRFFGDSN